VSFADKLAKLDRRWLFLAMAVAVVVPLLAPLGLPGKAPPMAKAVYYAVDELPEGATVLVSVDVDPASTPELEPFFRAVIKHLKKRKAKLVFMTLWPQAPPLVERWLEEEVKRPTFPGDRAYHVLEDYVWLGFREGKQAVIAGMGQDLWATFGGTAHGVPLADIPLMHNHRKLADFPLIVLVSAGAPGAKEYVQVVAARYELKMVAACTAVSTTDLSPYYPRQLAGLAGGLTSTAQYEIMVAKLVGNPPKAGLGAKALDALNIGHLVIIAAIVLGNAIYFMGRWRLRRGRATRA
jgi:hypothetical protein